MGAIRIDVTKIILLSVVMISFSCCTHSHASTLNENVVEHFNCCNHEAAYYLRGGNPALLNDLYSSLLKSFPVSQDSVKRRAVVKFVVLVNGSIDPNSIQIVRNNSVPEEYMDAAIEAIKNLGNFEPGKTNGTPLNTWLYLPVLYPVPLDKIITSE